jgi:L-aspartate oxidase
LSLSSRNFVTLAALIAKSALWREESRGGHFRTDHPETSVEFQVHSIQQLGRDIRSAETINFTPKVGV